MNQLVNQIKQMEQNGTRIVSFDYEDGRVRNVLLGSLRMAEGPWGQPFDGTRSIQQGPQGGLYLKGLANNAPDPAKRERIYGLAGISNVKGL